MRGPTFTLGQLAEVVEARLVGDPAVPISGLASLRTARSGELSHLSSAAYRAELATTGASAVILAERDLERWRGPALVTDDPYLAFARVSQLFDRLPHLEEGVHSSAWVDVTATISPSARIGPGVSVGPRTRIGDGARLYANSVVGEECEVGPDCRLMPHAVLYGNVRLGARCVIHAGAVIGADGFGFTPGTDGRLAGIAQLGGVTIGNDVSIGASSSVDRGTLEDTVIEEGVKIDNQVQIGHNCHVGAHTVICGCVGVVGSTRIGRHCVLAGGVGIGGDRPISIADRVVVSSMTHVTTSIAEPGIYSGGVLHSRNLKWKKNALRFARLDDLFHRVRALERVLQRKGGRPDRPDQENHEKDR